MSRIHDRIDIIEKTAVQIETSAKMMEKSVEKICLLVYGNGKDGIMGKIVRNDTRVNIQWWLLGLLIAGLLGTCWVVIKQTKGV
jgi:hypothetical protein